MRRASFEEDQPPEPSRSDRAWLVTIAALVIGGSAAMVWQAVAWMVG